MTDFQFLAGRWTIHHRRLNEPLAGRDSWPTFDTEYEAWSMLDGAASIDRLTGVIDGKTFEGISVRTLQRDTGEWTIYWMDGWNPQLREQVRGRFEAGVGIFYGTEVYRGRPTGCAFYGRRSRPSRRAGSRLTRIRRAANGRRTG